MQKWEDFKFLCFSQNIDTEIIEACKTFVAEDHHIRNNWHKDRHVVTTDLGYAECSDIDTVEKGINDIKDNIELSTCDYDKLGRSKQKILIKKLRQNPHKGLTRIVLKTYWLFR